MGKSNFREAKPVLIFNGAKVLISIFRSMHCAAQVTGTSLQAIAFCCSGKYVATRGLYFRHLHPNIEIDVADLGNLLLDDYDKMSGEERRYYTVRAMAHKRDGVKKKQDKKPKNNNDE